MNIVQRILLNFQNLAANIHEVRRRGSGEFEIPKIQVFTFIVNCLAVDN